MKKLLLLVVIVAIFSQAKAQQLFQFQPTDTLKENPLEKYFNVKPGGEQLFQLQLNPGQMWATTNPQVKANTFDHMPIALMEGYSKMPVVKLGGTDKMPVLKLGEGYVVIPDQKQTP